MYLCTRMLWQNEPHELYNPADVGCVNLFPNRFEPCALLWIHCESAYCNHDIHSVGVVLQMVAAYSSSRTI